MSEVKRYTGLDFNVSPTGVYVLASDYDTLSAAHTTMRLELAQWKEMCRVQTGTIAELEAALAGVTDDMHHWHKAYMELKYPNGSPPSPGATEDRGAEHD